MQVMIISIYDWWEYYELVSQLQLILHVVSPCRQRGLVEQLPQTDILNNQFMRQHACVEILSTREVWRARKRRKSCSRRSNSSFLSALQTSQVVNISTYAQLKHELIVFNIVKAINAEVNLNFNYCSTRLTSMRQCLRDYIFLPQLCFCLETERKFAQVAYQITLKKMVNSILRCQKTVQ